MNTWLITGTSSGLGRHLTEQLLSRGDRVAATVRRPDALADLSHRHDDRLWIATLDIRDPARIRQVVNRAFADLGIDVVVSNAGYGLVGAAEEVSDEQIADQIDTNLYGSIQLVRAALPHLRNQRHGRIIQISSMGGQIALPGASIYHATKWGIEGFLESVRQEIAGFGIEITIIEPGSTRTNFGGHSMAVATPMSAYDEPLAAMRPRFGTGSNRAPGDPAKMAAAIITSADQSPAPSRVVLGSDAYRYIGTALRDRLAALEEGRDIAHTTDALPTSTR
jgi:NAD(P)-dependent dehydrogenase (short-subunit alcohol dehydrogenase family)